MTQATHIALDSTKSKSIARAIQKRFDELNSPIKLNHAYEALALAHKYPNWATMKAAITPRNKAEEPAGNFIIGHHATPELWREEDGEEVVIPYADALNHVHGFSTSSLARYDLLRRLSLNAMKAGSSCVFVEPVSDAQRKSEIINDLLSLATEHGRRNDFFVLDFSVPGSRVGNTCDLLGSFSDPVDAASFLLFGYQEKLPNDHRGPDDHYRARIFLEHCASRVRGRGERFTISGFRRELDEIQRNGYPEHWREEFRHNFEANCTRVRLSLVRHLAVFETENRRILDAESSWPGFSGMFNRSQVLVVFIDPDAGGKGTAMHDHMLAQLRNAVLSAPEDGRVPDMLLLNDVDFLGSGTQLATRASKGRVCIVSTDQCPTSPAQFPREPLSFRSEWPTQLGIRVYHGLVLDGSERRIWPGPK